MYQILIADDERKDRNIIRILLERRYAGQFYLFEAENGGQALEILRREAVQLLLLDINMPGLSGIDVLHSLETRPYIIMLTAYDHFVYTQEALRCGARDYLLKPPVREEFYRAIDRFVQTWEHPVLQSRSVFTRELARQLMYYGGREKIEGLLEMAGVQGRLALCGLLTPETAREDRDALLDEVENVLGRCPAEYAAAPWRGGTAVFLFCRRGEDAPAALELLARLTHGLESDLRVAMEIRTGPVAPVPDGYPETFLRLAGPADDRGGAALPPVRQAELEQAVRRRDFGRIMETLRPQLEALDGFGDENVIKYQLLTALSQCGRQFQPQGDNQTGSQYLSGLIGARGQEQVAEFATRYVQWLLRECRGGGRPRNSTVQLVLEKVREDCSRPWSMDSLADSLHVNAYYLSHLFKEYTGQCFTDYLADRRIERAVELMRTTDLSLARIGEQVGYSDPNYFSRVFKKRKGVGPREFCQDWKTSTDLRD